MYVLQTEEVVVDKPTSNVKHSSHSRFVGVVIQGGVPNSLVKDPTWVIQSWR